MQLEDLKKIQSTSTVESTDLLVIAKADSKTPKSITVANFLSMAPQLLSGAGAVNLTAQVTAFTSTGGAQALTLADGTPGQRKTIIHEVDGGSGVLTPTTKTGFTTITFTAVGESAVLVFLATRGWMIESLRGAVAA